MTFLDDAIKDGAINSAIMTQVKLLSDYNDTNPTVKLTCSSFGGAATTIQWMIDCSPECRNVTQKLESGVESAYDSSIIVHGRVGLVTCNFSNDKPTYKSAEIDFRTYEGKSI